MASISRDILEERSPSSHGFFSLLSLICFRPRKFFRLLDRTPMKYSLLLAALILGLLSFSAIQQAELSANTIVPEFEEEFLPDAELESTSLASSIDPNQSWMIGFSAMGKQAIFWLVLTIILSEVSLLKGKAPNFGRSLQIAVWASLPFAMMAALQILFVMVGGRINQLGFTGFLDDWQSYHELNSYLQSAVYALAAQFTFFSFWHFFLIYKGAKETLHGNRIVVAFVLAAWLLLLTLAYGFEHYQNADAIIFETTEFSYEDEALYPDEMPMEDPLYLEPEGEMSHEELP